MRGFKFLGLICAVIMIIGLLLPGCKKEEATGTLDIGIATALTGPAGSVGTNIQRGVEMAIADQNAAGGVTIAGKRYLLNGIVRDNKFDPATGKINAEELVYKLKVKAIFGPLPIESPSMQTIANDNKVLMFLCSPHMTTPKQPYCFSLGSITSNQYATVLEYLKEYYPDAKSVVSFNPDTADSVMYMADAKKMFDYYGLNFLGDETFPFPVTTDFAPFVQKLNTYNADIIDLALCGGTAGPLVATMVKQIRESGFEGIILMPTIPPTDIMVTLPQQYLNKIITNDINIDGPIVTNAYRDLINGYVEQYKEKPIDIFAQTYNPAYAFFKFLDGQKTMDTTQWMEGFANYEWESVYGEHSQWVGEPFYGINRALLANFWASEWKNGKLETNFVAKLPLELWVSK